MATNAPMKALSRRSKALAIVPVAILSGLWTANLVTTSATAAGTAGHHRDVLPDGTRVPTTAIQAPASVPVPGRIAPGVPNGSADAVVNGASTNGIPAPALTAYQRAAQIIDSADRSCHMPWELIAAIGRVESDHGQYAGNHLTAKGIAVPGIYGPELNGRNGTQAIPDTDGGLIDHDKVWDRAVGPMQFIPSTWQVVKVDADGDGQRNPQDINDASLATAVYLCSGGENLSTPSGRQQAVFRYNHSQQYVDLVLRLMAAYTHGDYTALPAGTSAGTLFTPDYTTARAHRTHARSHHATPARQHRAPSGSGSGSTKTGSTTPTSPSGSGGGTPSAPTAPSPPSGSGSGGLLGGGGSGSSGGGAGTVTQPVEQTLNQLGEATTFCSSQLQAAGLTGSVLDTAVPKCAAKVGDMTKDQAAATIPNTLQGVLDWLGLSNLLGGLGVG
jgi:membrane-bound lytic murein transglycosylase B